MNTPGLGVKLFGDMEGVVAQAVSVHATVDERSAMDVWPRLRFSPLGLQQCALQVACSGALERQRSAVAKRANQAIHGLPLATAYTTGDLKQLFDSMGMVT
eukprot:15238661-Alexandrium_andersonii.AAC.1